MVYGIPVMTNFPEIPDERQLSSRHLDEFAQFVEWSHQVSKAHAIGARQFRKDFRRSRV